MLRTIPVKSSQVNYKAAFRQFMGWALLEQDIDKPMFGWLPPKPGFAAFGEECEQSGVWYKQFLLNLHHNKAKRRWWGLSKAFRDAYAHECNNPQSEEREGSTLSCWREYISMAC